MTRIMIQALVKMISALSFLPLPRKMDIGTEEPTPIRSAREKLMMTKGSARLSAAKAVSPRKWPTKIPSMV